MVNSYMKGGNDVKENFNVKFGESDKCPFCHSENIEKMYNPAVVRGYKKVEGNDITECNLYPFNTDKIFCRECGQFSEKMRDKDLKEYNELEPNFT